MRAAVVKVIDTMWERYDQPLSLSELADEAAFSRFYLSRIFRNVTGTSPGRFLTAIRLFRAKNLLLETSFSVSDISYLVGYNSPGTFSARFTLSVGMSPTRYRHQARTGFRCPAPGTPRAWTTNSVELIALIPETGLATRTYLGVFGKSFPSTPHVRCTTFEESGRYRIASVPEGYWTIRAVTVGTTGLDTKPWQRRPILVSDLVPITIRQEHPSTFVRLALRQCQTTDLPILPAIPELDSFQIPKEEADGRSIADFPGASAMD